MSFKWLPKLKHENNLSFLIIYVKPFMILILASWLFTGWKIRNEFSIAQLWLGILKYYTLEINLREFTVSVATKAIMKRKAKNWSVNILSIEGMAISILIFNKIAMQYYDKFSFYLCLICKECLKLVCIFLKNIFSN